MRSLILFFVALACYGQSCFTAVYEKTLAGAAGAASIQQPASPSKSASLIKLQLYGSVATTFTLEGAGIASTTLSTAIARTRPGDLTLPTVQFYTDSNAAAPATVINKYVLAAGETKAVSFEDPNIRAKPGLLHRSPAINYTVRSDSITGDIKVTFLWCEE